MNLIQKKNQYIKTNLKIQYIKDMKINKNLILLENLYKFMLHYNYFKKILV